MSPLTIAVASITNHLHFVFQGSWMGLFHSPSHKKLIEWKKKLFNNQTIYRRRKTFKSLGKTW